VTLDEEQAAECLGLSVKSIRLLIEGGILKPHQRLLRENQEGKEAYFSRHALEKFGKISSAYIGLITLNKAAEKFKLYPSSFHGRYVKTGRIKAVVIDSSPAKLYFRLVDVDRLLEIENQTIDSAKAADILRIKITSIKSLMSSGDLAPISGPSVDGFGKRLFLRKDVEKLHTDREAFKAIRASSGGSSRFGKPAGPKQCPVRQKIRPRVEQLNRQTGAKLSLLSGYQMHQQLMSEGYQVSISTVYLCLRDLRQ
jgi:hypothetical protein